MTKLPQLRVLLSLWGMLPSSDKTQHSSANMQPPQREAVDSRTPYIYWYWQITLYTYLLDTSSFRWQKTNKLYNIYGVFKSVQQRQHTLFAIDFNHSRLSEGTEELKKWSIWLCFKNSFWYCNLWISLFLWHDTPSYLPKQRRANIDNSSTYNKRIPRFL